MRPASREQFSRGCLATTPNEEQWCTSKKILGEKKPPDFSGGLGGSGSCPIELVVTGEAAGTEAHGVALPYATTEALDAPAGAFLYNAGFVWIHGYLPRGVWNGFKWAFFA